MSKRPPPKEELEEHDTVPDEDREDLPRRTVKRRPAPEAQPMENAGRTPPPRPVLKGRPISKDEALAPAALSRVRVREAIVRIQETPDAAPLPPSPPAKVEVRIEFVRSRDETQRIERLGEDGFRVEGVATGGAAVSVGVEGRIFRIDVARGDPPEKTAERLSGRLEAAYIVERPDPAAAILKERSGRPLGR